MRKRRELINGLSYHVTARANRQEFILNSDHMKDIFLKIIEKAKKKYHFKIKNICIMENHIHLIIKPDEKENLSRIMQWILSVFAMRFNKIYGYIGHVWYDRFKSKVISSLMQYIRTFVYVCNNPVKAEIVSSAGEYRYSGFKWMLDNDYRIVDKPKAYIWDEVLLYINGDGAC